MPAPLESSPLSGSPALLAFLRGIERRAWVFADTQCGDEALARQALASALQEFVRESQGEAIARWPLHFWTALLRQPALTTPRADAQTPLATLTVGPRAALLLRLVAGLDFSHAAAVLGVSEAAYRFALSRALADWERIAPAPGALEALRDQLLARVKQLEPARTDELAALRTDALSPPSEAPVVPPPERFGRESTPRWPRWAVASLVILALAFVATFFWPFGTALAPNATEPLPVETITATPGYDDSAVVTHPDYALLAERSDRIAIDHAALLSWIAAGSPTAESLKAANSLEESALEDALHPDMDQEQSP